MILHYRMNCIIYDALHDIVSCDIIIEFDKILNHIVSYDTI